MTPRQRFNAIMSFARPDRLPLWDLEGISESAVRKWILAGDLPLGISRQDAVEFDPRTIIRLDTDPLPAFVPRTLSEDQRWRTTVDEYGFTVRTLKEQTVGPTIYYYLAGSVGDRRDWQRMKARFDPSDPRRRPRNWQEELFARHNAADAPLGLCIQWGPGRGIKNGYMMGLERFLDVLVSEPAWVEEIFDFWADFVAALATDWLEHVRFDFAYFLEDGMGFKNSTMVSPEMYKRLWAPYVGRVIDLLRGAGVEVIGYYTSGNVGPLIPAMLDLGVNLHLPLESAAGLDARQLRRRYGRDLRLMGNISRQALMAGPQAVEKEFQEKVPPLVESGGYIPAIDDLVMPDMPYASVRRYVELVREFRP
jgi:hypothetical protein